MKSRKIILIVSLTLLFIASVFAKESEKNLESLGDSLKHPYKNIDKDWIELEEGNWGKSGRL